MKINVGVFFGGCSVEHEIAVISALQAIHAFDKDKYEIIPLYLSKNGQLYTGDSLLDIENYKDTGKLLASCQKIALARNDGEVCSFRIPPKMFGNNILNKLDVIFPIVHGTNCEDGTVQGYLELLNIPYVGSNVLASALGMDKVATKNMLKSNGIPVLDSLSYSAKEWYKAGEAIVGEIEEKIGYPVIVKPVNLGSSVGINKAANKEQLENAMDLAFSFAPRVLVEKAITNLKEVNCSVLGDYDNPQPSVCEEPIGNDEILSYNDKYLSKGASKGMSSTKRKLPADIPAEMDREIKDLAVRVFKVLGCHGVVRIDFLIDQDTRKVYANEINTIPGSLSFYLWEATNKSFRELLDDLINLALQRDREKQKITYTYDTNIFSLQGKGAK